MTHCPHITEEVRHARLFELIRQENIVKECAGSLKSTKRLDMRDAQHFLKKAHRSLIAEADRGKIL